MKIHLVREKTIREFITKHAGSRIAFEEWLSKIKSANWSFPGDIKNTFATADLLGNGSYRVVFDIAGNRFRMICKYGFGEKEVHLFICWIGTHSAYDKLCRDGKQFTVSLY